MDCEQLRRTAVILVVCVLLIVALASVRTLSPSKPAIEAGPPVVIQVIQPEQRFEDRWTELPPPAKPIELALAEVRPSDEGVPQVSLFRQAMADPTPISPSDGRMAQAKKVERDPVCGTKGRRYFKLNGRQVWRCIRR
jgi:hypothetical protein